MADGILKFLIECDNKSALDSLHSVQAAGVDIAGKMAVASVAAAGAVGTAVTAITKSAVDSYAEYEQLVGGTQLMLGDAYDSVMQRAQNAYATVQMSANEYLQQVNSFATGLKTAMGGDEQAAADLADKVVQAQADVVAATGASREAVEHAFSGIMKSNFTMVDNLQIGIKPTKEGFQELIDTVNDWNSANGRMTNYTIDNLADCQSALVDYIEMQGMAGYAANEGATTIEGATASMKGAWQNLVTGLAMDDADIGTLVSNFSDTVVTLGEMIVPRAISTAGTVVETVADHGDEFAKRIIDALAEQLGISLDGSVGNMAGQVLLWIANSVQQASSGITPESVSSVIDSIASNMMDFATSGGLQELAETGARVATSVIAGAVEYVATHAVEIVGAIAGAIGSGVVGGIDGIIDGLFGLDAGTSHANRLAGEAAQYGMSTEEYLGNTTTVNVQVDGQTIATATAESRSDVDGGLILMQERGLAF